MSAEAPLASPALVLRHHPYGESAAVLVALTASHGKVRCDFKGAKGARHSRGAALEPLTRVALQWTTGRELGRVVAVRVEHSPLSDIRGYWQGAFLEYAAGLLDALCPEDEPQPGFFRLAGAAAGPLLQAPPWAALVYLEFFSLHLAGLLPDLERCPRCGKPAAALHLGPGSARCDDCPASADAPREDSAARPARHGSGPLVRLAGEPLRFFRALRRTAPAELAALAAGRPLPQLEAPLAILLQGALEREIPGRALVLSLFRTAERGA